MEDLRHIIPLFIPIIAIVMGIGIGMMGLYLDYQKKSRMFELHHKERLLAIERGMEVPPLPAEFFMSRKSHRSDKARSLRLGLVFTCVGVAVAFALIINEGFQAATWALIPIAVGVANLVYYYVVPELEKTNSASPSPTL
jgi:hypothetical protein